MTAAGDARRFERLGDRDPASFDRPRRRTRPRTKERPTYDDAVPAVVVTVDRGRFTCDVTVEDGPDAGLAAGSSHEVVAVKARPLGRKGVVVGDRVRLVGDVSGTPDTLARIVEVAPRVTALRRTADDDDPVERVVVANADQLVVVVALADPPPRTGLVDRAVVAAFDAGLEPLLCLTKADLASPDPLLAIYRPLGVASVVSRRDQPVTAVRERLAGRTSVLLGHSGVGKSTLVNALVPGADRAIGRVNAVTGRGRHTSTSALMIRLPAEDGGWIVDTPGIRSFGLAHVRPATLINAFPDLDALTVACSRGCTHADSEPECGLDEGVRDGVVEPARVESFRRLLASRG